MRLLVFGSRTWTDRGAVWNALGALPRTTVIEGEAKGADTLARQWAQFYRVPVEPFPVDTSKDGPWPAAGHRRNARMYNEGRPERAIGFVSGKRGDPFSRGSQGMYDICGLGGTPVRIVREDGREPTL